MGSLYDKTKLFSLFLACHALFIQQPSNTGKERYSEIIVKIKTHRENMVDLCTRRTLATKIGATKQETGRIMCEKSKVKKKKFFSWRPLTSAINQSTR